MNVEVTKLPESRVALKIELAPQEVESALDRTYKQLVQRVTVPGFRKGKAPRPVVERMVGQEYFLHEATEEAIRWGYRKAIDQENLTPVDEAEIEGDEDGHAAHLHPGEPFHFEISVAVKPEVQLPDLSAISVEREAVEVSDQDVDDLLKELQTRSATLEPSAVPARIGDVVTMNVTGRAGGEDVINEENADFEIKDEEAGETDQFLPGLSAELVGSTAGDIKETVLQLPAEYQNPELAGKSLALRILVKEVKHPVLPELDDEFAQTVSRFETFDELREALRENIRLEREREAEQKLVNDAIEAVSSRTFVEIPPVLIEEEMDRMVEDIKESLQRSGIQWDQYLQVVGKTEAEIRNDMREDAARSVKTSLVLGEIADRENVEVSGREVNAALEELFRATDTGEAERRRLRQSPAVRANIRSRLRRQAAIHKLVQTVAGGEDISADVSEEAAEGTLGVAPEAEETVPAEVGG